VTEHHRVRRLALQGLCCLDVRGERSMEPVLVFLRDSRERAETIAQAEQVLQDVFARRDEADKLLAGQSEHWDVSRMALVDRNILRLAVWELLTERTPKKIVINEALQLAKEFASAESSRFINGVLDAASRRVREGASGRAEVARGDGAARQDE
jgi:transcription antitermination factor NusB